MNIVERTRFNAYLQAANTLVVFIGLPGTGRTALLAQLRRQLEHTGGRSIIACTTAAQLDAAIRIVDSRPQQRWTIVADDVLATDDDPAWPRLCALVHRNPNAGAYVSSYDGPPPELAGDDHVARVEEWELDFTRSEIRQLLGTLETPVDHPLQFIAHAEHAWRNRVILVVDALRLVEERHDPTAWRTYRIEMVAASANEALLRRLGPERAWQGGYRGFLGTLILLPRFTRRLIRALQPEQSADADLTRFIRSPFCTNARTADAGERMFAWQPSLWQHAQHMLQAAGTTSQVATTTMAKRRTRLAASLRAHGRLADACLQLALAGDLGVLEQAVQETFRPSDSHYGAEMAEALQRIPMEGLGRYPGVLFLRAYAETALHGITKNTVEQFSLFLTNTATPLPDAPDDAVRHIMRLMALASTGDVDRVQQQADETLHHLQRLRASEQLLHPSDQLASTALALAWMELWLDHIPNAYKAAMLMAEWLDPAGALADRGHALVHALRELAQPGGTHGGQVRTSDRSGFPITSLDQDAALLVTLMRAIEDDGAKTAVARSKAYLDGAAHKQIAPIFFALHLFALILTGHEVSAADLLRDTLGRGRMQWRDTQVPTMVVFAGACAQLMAGQTNQARELIDHACRTDVYALLAEALYQLTLDQPHQSLEALLAASQDERQVPRLRTLADMLRAASLMRLGHVEQASDVFMETLLAHTVGELRFAMLFVFRRDAKTLLALPAARIALAPADIARLRAASMLHRSTPIAATLSPTELEVLQAVAYGLTNDQIAQRRHVSVNTVRSQLHSIYQKLGTANRAEVVLMATRQGLIDGTVFPQQSQHGANETPR